MKRLLLSLLLSLSSYYLHAMNSDAPQPIEDDGIKITRLVRYEYDLSSYLERLMRPAIEEKINKRIGDLLNDNQLQEAAIQLLLLSKEQIQKTSVDEIKRKALRSVLDEKFEKLCDKYALFQEQRISIFASNIAALSEWVFRGYVYAHCFDKRNPQEERRMKVVLRDPTSYMQIVQEEEPFLHQTLCGKYEELGLTIGKEIHPLKVLHPYIRLKYVRQSA